MMNMHRYFMALGCLFVVSVSSFAEEAVDTRIAGDANAGKIIFEHTCFYCHTSNEESKFGPSLKGVSKRRSVAWLDEWLKNPRDMIKHDADAKVVRGNNKYNMTMPTLPDMQDEKKRADVIAYLLRDF